jgi:hypothetical protein
VLDDEAVRPLDPRVGLPDVRGRHPVLASGSNQSPEQLTRKFGGHGLGAVYVLEAWVDGLDAVYSAHFTAYGSLPATVVAAPGVRARFFVTWLTDAQLDRMHETEALGENYEYARIDDVHIVHHGESVSTHIYAYLSRPGALTVDGDPVALAAVRAEGRRTPAMHQREVQEVARRRLAPEVALEHFIRDNIGCAKTRRARTAALGGLDGRGPAGVKGAP